MEILKEQQNRINNRQMRDLVLRQKASQGGTYNLNRHQQTTNITDDFEDAVSEASDRKSDMSNHEAGLRARIEAVPEKQETKDKSDENIARRNSSTDLRRRRDDKEKTPKLLYEPTTKRCLN